MVLEVVGNNPIKIVLKKENGQAMAEALILTSAIFIGTLFLLAIFFNQIISMAIDDSLETYFFCQIQKIKTCRIDLATDLKKLGLNHIQIFENNQPSDYYEIKLIANTSYNYEVYKKRILHPPNTNIDFL